MFNLTGKSLGRYHVIEPLGEGGMAAVFKAYDTTLEREVAIKVIRLEMGMDDSFRRRFQREARALAQLDHPYILKVLDYGEQDGMPYLVMPYLPGGTLKDRLGSPIPYLKAAGLLAPVARALEFAHCEGIIHRDVKPANILIGKTGEPMLSDFGIAKILDQPGATQLTATGAGIGTPDYMAPEQWLGKVEARTDVYSLGIVFYELVTGRRPYVADTPAAVFLKHREDPLPRPRQFIPDLPEAVEQVIFKALAKSIEDRYATMGEFAAALERLAQGQSAMVIDRAAPTLVRPLPSAGRPDGQPYSSAFPWKIVAIGAVVVVVLGAVCMMAGGGLLLSGWFNGKSETPVAAVTPTHMEVTLTAATGTSISPSPTPWPQETSGDVLPTPKQPIESIEGLPEDIPVLPENNGDLVTQETNGVTIFMYSTNKELQAVKDFFNERMAADGWELVNTTTSQESTMLVFQKDKRATMITLSENRGSVWIQIMPDVSSSTQ